jgi:hypothetical protein
MTILDETADIVVILKTHLSPDELSAALRHVELHVSAHVTEAVTNRAVSSFPSQEKHELNSKSHSAHGAYELIAAEHTTFVVWRSSLHLARPRVRVQRPMVSFSANLSLHHTSKGAIRDSPDLLKSYEPLPANVLAPFRFDPKLSKVDVLLSGSRILKVAPASTAVDATKIIRGASTAGVPIVPALFIRITHVAVADVILASVHLDTSRFVTGLLKLDTIKCEASGRQVEPLVSGQTVAHTTAGDETILVYRISNPKSSWSDDEQPVIDVMIEATAMVEQDLTTQLSITWQKYFDHTADKASPRYSWSRPTSVISTTALRNSASATPRPGSSETHRERTLFHISGPAVASLEEEFRLHVQCSNRSSRARRFGLAMQLSRKTPPMRPRASTSATQAVAHIFQPSASQALAQQKLLAVNPDLRIGPLPSGATFETDLVFRALDAGVLELGPLHIVDLELRQTVDIVDLPDIIIAERNIKK